MSNQVSATAQEITKKSICIVKLGPPTAVDGFRLAEYYQVTIDPSKVSPSGEYIRLGANLGDEINGWQRVEALTVVEILGEWADDETFPEMTIGANGVTMMVQDN